MEINDHLVQVEDNPTEVMAHEVEVVGEVHLSWDIRTQENTWDRKAGEAIGLQTKSWHTG